jgi:hypothetical protein
MLDQHSLHMYGFSAVLSSAGGAFIYLCLDCLHFDLILRDERRHVCAVRQARCQSTSVMHAGGLI